MRTEIKRWGNSAAIRIPTKILAAAQVDISSDVSVTVQDGKIVIEPIKNNTKKHLRLPYSESQLLTGLTPETAHADEVVPVYGAEVGD